MTYAKNTWIDDVSPVSASRMNNIETGIEDAHTTADAALPSASYTAVDVLAKIKTVDGAGSGLDADTLDGYGTSVSANADTVAVRNSAGFMHNVLHHQTYSNLNASIGNIMTQVSAADGFIRPSSPAQVRTALNVAQTRITSGLLEYWDGSAWKVAGNVIDVTTLVPINKEVESISGTGAYQTILSVSGKGFIESFYAHQGVGTADFSIRLTVDGVVKILLGTALGSTPIGLVSKDDLVVSATSTSTGGSRSGVRRPAHTLMGAMLSTPTSFKQYPTTDNSDGMILLGDNKVWFNSSLLLEIRCYTTSGNTYNYHYSGAYV